MGQNEAKVIRYLDNFELDIFSMQELSHILPPQSLRGALYSLVRAGVIVRIEKGVYVRANFHDDFTVGSFLVSDGGIAYWSALSYHGLTEQIPNVVFVQTSKKKKNKRILGTQFKFVHVKPEKITGYVTEGVGNHRFRVTDVEKTIVDAFDQPQYSGGTSVVFQAFANAQLKESKLIKYCEAINNIAVAKRLGFLVELLAKPNLEGFREYALEKTNEKYSPLVAGYPTRKMPSNRKWRLILNLPKKDIFNMVS